MKNKKIIKIAAVFVSLWVIAIAGVYIYIFLIRDEGKPSDTVLPSTDRTEPVTTETPKDDYVLGTLDDSYSEWLEDYSEIEKEEIYRKMGVLVGDAAAAEDGTAVNNGVQYEMLDYYFTRDPQRAADTITDVDDKNAFLGYYASNELYKLKENDCFAVFTLKITNITRERIYGYSFNRYNVCFISPALSYSDTSAFIYGTYQPGEGSRAYYKSEFESGESVETTCIISLTDVLGERMNFNWYFGTDSSSDFNFIPDPEVQKLIPIERKELG